MAPAHAPESSAPALAAASTSASPACHRLPLVNKTKSGAEHGNGDRDRTLVDSTSFTYKQHQGHSDACCNLHYLPTSGNLDVRKQRYHRYHYEAQRRRTRRRLLNSTATTTTTATRTASALSATFTPTSTPTSTLPSNKTTTMPSIIKPSADFWPTCAHLLFICTSFLLLISTAQLCQARELTHVSSRVVDHHQRNNNNGPFDSFTNQNDETVSTRVTPLGQDFAEPTLEDELILDQDLHGEGSSGGKIGPKVNRSLIMLDKSQANDPKVNNMRRLLVRQLANLIMNHEPETIAQNMAGARVSGQMVSESGLEGDSNSINGQGSSETLLDAGHASVLIDSDTATSSETLESFDLSPPGQQDSDQQQTTIVDPNSSANSNVDDQFVTCPPDYEDQTMIEAGNGNLTIEQQQQLLAGADSSGLLSSNSNNSDTNLLQPRQPANTNQCVHPGNRMIEVITKVITPILFSIIIVVGLLGNIIVMLVILEDRKTERELTPTNLLILDLSLADLSFIIFCIPFTGWDYSVGHWVFGLLWCKFNQYLIVVCALSSIYTLVLMSVDRFMAIVYPIECISYRTSKNTLYAIYIKWIAILLIASPTISMHGLIDLPLGPDQYTCRFLTDQFNPLHFQIIFFITSYLFPLILIFCLYLSLLKKLWFGNKPHGHKESSKMLESKKKVTWLVAGIVVVFALCWCPIQVMLILMRLKSHKITATYVAIQVFAHTLGYMNSCVNPIVYAFASETFHNSFKRSYFGRLCCVCSSSGTSSSGAGGSSTHQQQTAVHDIERTITGRHSHNNTSPLNHHHVTSPQHHGDHRQHQQLVEQQHLNHLPTSLHTNGRKNIINDIGVDDSHVSTTTLLMTPYSSSSITKNQDDNVNISKTTVSLPLETRDRSASPASVSGSQSSAAKTQSTCERSKQPLIPRQATISSSLTTTTKQQLVAHVAQSGNQVSHRCEPRYD